jgi:hypothetical protein
VVIVAERLRIEERQRAPAGQRQAVVDASLPATILNLQRTAGNRAVGRILARQPVAKTAPKARQIGLRNEAVLQRFTNKAAAFIARNRDGRLIEFAIYLGAAINVELDELGIPDVRVVTSKVDIPASGQFFADSWTMVINSKHFSYHGAKTMGELTPGEAAIIAGTILHEARHAEQHFRIARLEAAEGKDPGARWLDEDAAKAAAASPLDLSARNAAEVKEAKAWRTNVYGADAVYRQVVTLWQEDLRDWAHRLADATNENAEDLRQRLGGLLSGWAKPDHAIDVIRKHLPSARARRANQVIADVTRITTEYARVEAAFARVPAGADAAALKPLAEATKELFRAVIAAYMNQPVEADAHAAGNATFAAYPGTTP